MAKGQDYVVNFRGGKNDLTPQIEAVKKQLKATGDSTDAIDAIGAKLNKVAEGTMPLNRQMRELQKILATLNLNGLDHTDLYNQVAQQAGNIKDAMADASDSVTRFSSDTRTLDSVIGAFNGVTGAISATQGAMALLGVESDDVAAVTAKMTAVMAMANGVQQVANVLNKNSALMMNLKAVAANISAKATAMEAAATTGQTAAATAGIAANTGLAGAFYMVSAAISSIPLFGWIAAAVTALAGGVVYLANSADEAREEVADFNSYINEGNKKYAEAKVELDAYQDILKDFNGSKEEEKRLVEELNNKYGKELGYSESLAEWKETLAQKSEAFADSIRLEAEAQAIAAKMAENYAKILDIQQSIKDKSYKTSWFKTDAQDEAALKEEIDKIEKANEEYSELYKQKKNALTATKAKYDIGGHTDPKTKTTNTKSGGSKSTGKNTNTEADTIIKAYDKAIKAAQEKLEKDIDILPQDKIDEAKNNISKLTAKRDLWKIRTSVEPPKKEDVEKIIKNLDDGSAEQSVAYNILFSIKPEFEEGSIQDLENKKKALEEQLNKGQIKGADVSQATTQIEEYEKKIKELKVAYKMADPEPLEGSFEHLNKMLAEMTSNLNNGFAPKVGTEEYDKFIEKIKEIKQQAKDAQQAVEDALNPRSNAQIKLDKYKEVKGKYDDEAQVVNDSVNAGIMSEEEGRTMMLDIQTRFSEEDIYEQMEEIVGDPSKMPKYELDVDTERAKGQMDAVMGAVSDFGSAFSSLGQTLDMPALNIMGIIMQGVANMILGMGEAIAQASSLGPIGWIAFAATATAQTLALIAQVKSAGAFANGGIIQGNSYMGDRLVANVNAGEMILNKGQQSRLFQLLNGQIGGINGNTEVKFILKGSDLYGSINNYRKEKGKTAPHLKL